MGLIHYLVLCSQVLAEDEKHSSNVHDGLSGGFHTDT